MSNRSFVVRRLGLASLARWGFLAGAMVACLPGFMCSGLFFWMTSTIYRTIQSWHQVGLTIIGQPLYIDFVQLLQLGRFADALGAVQALGLLGILLLTIVISVTLGVIVALSVSLLGILYNLGGGLKIELVEV